MGPGQDDGGHNPGLRRLHRLEWLRQDLVHLRPLPIPDRRRSRRRVCRRRRAFGRSDADRVRPHALGSLQALSAIGNILAAVSLGVVVPGDKLGWGWRGLYYIGALPALIAVFVFWRLKEPEKWVAAKAAAAKKHSSEQFGRLS